MQKAKRASIEFTIEWDSGIARHRDVYLAQKIDFWRDIFPGDFELALRDMELDGQHTGTFAAGELCESEYDKRLVKTFPRSKFQNEMGVEPEIGRFYPKSFAWQGLDCYKGDFHPFRILDIEGEQIVGDSNHPMATFPITLTARKTAILGPIEERGGVCNHVGELVTEKGPGMQTPFQACSAAQANKSLKSAFLKDFPLQRMDENTDDWFYAQPRMTQHIDSLASEQIRNLYARLITAEAGTTILDLMSSVESHLPDSFAGANIIGLGMNEAELQANPTLTQHIVHDLNQNHTLPFADDSMDHVICNLSIEYLTHPLKTVKEIQRVLKPGGLFVTTFSDRWFPPKAITLWTQIHPFERIQLVLDYYLLGGDFNNLNSYSIRGLPRPDDDKYSNQTHLSDPVFAVWGIKK